MKSRLALSLEFLILYSRLSFPLSDQTPTSLNIVVASLESDVPNLHICKKQQYVGCKNTKQF